MSTTKLAEALRLGIEALTCAGSHAECQSLEVYAKEQMRAALASYEAAQAEAKPADECEAFESWARSVWDLSATDDPLELQGRLLDAWKARAALEAKPAPAPADDREERPDFLAFNPAYQKAAERFAELHAEPVTVDHHEFAAARGQWRATLWTEDAIPTGTKLYAAPAAPAGKPVARVEQVKSSTQFRLIWLQQPVEGVLYAAPAASTPHPDTELLDWLDREASDGKGLHLACLSGGLRSAISARIARDKAASKESGND